MHPAPDGVVAFTGGEPLICLDGDWAPLRWHDAGAVLDDYYVATETPGPTWWNILPDRSTVYLFPLEDDITINFMSASAEDTGWRSPRVTFELIQDATGGRAVALAGDVLVPGGSLPTVDTTAETSTVMTFLFVGRCWVLESFQTGLAPV